MSNKWFQAGASVAIVFLLVGGLSCAHNQHLTAITVQPAQVTFQGVGGSVQFTATGTYVHPPETKDITSKVNWSVDSQNLVTFSTTMPGLVTDESVCGSGNVIASLTESQNFVSGSAFVTGAGLGTAVCNQALLTVSIVGSGTVTSTGAAVGAQIKCPGTCSAIFTLGTSVGLTATPTGIGQFVSWSPQGATGCTTVTGNTCSVTLNTNDQVTATFNP